MFTIEDIDKAAGSLPCTGISIQLNNAINKNQCVVVTAPPGAGKSTILPLTILADRHENKIVMLEPRRLAARQVAERMAQILGEPVGKTIGYRIRFESKTSSDTHIGVVTEGILTRMLVADPTLDGIGIIIFDEFHERSLNADLSLALTRQTQQILRPDLKVVIMSATIDANEICKKLHAPLIESKGRMYPVKIEYADDSQAISTSNLSSKEISQKVAATIMRAHRNDEGDILAFLPGQAEIRQCYELIQPALNATTVYPLYGNLPAEMQRRAIAPSKDGERKIVLATPVAETSVTIEGVRVVVDSGLCRSPEFNPQTGLSSLKTVRISKDMATQRAGRAGRVAEGVCYRLWTQASEHLMQEQRIPEIISADLSSMLLSLYDFGEKNYEDIPWLTFPLKSNAEKAKELLLELEAIDSCGNMTMLGKRIANMPCHPRIAKMMVCAEDKTTRSLACDIAALLEERDPMALNDDADITLRIATLRRLRKCNNIGRWQRIAQIAAEYRRMAKTDESNQDPVPQDVGSLIARAYPERIAMSTDNIGTFRMANGSNVRVTTNNDISACKWIAIASLSASSTNTGKVYLAAPLSEEFIDKNLTKETDNVSWNSREGCITTRREKRVGKLVVGYKPIQDVNHELLKGIVCEAVKKDGLSMLSWSDDKVVALQQRIASVATWHPELHIPDISTDHLMTCASEWLAFYLENNGHVLSTVQELRKINLQEALWAILPYDLQTTVNQLAPTHIIMPTGSKIRVDYRQGAEAPVLSVRLQECFGMQETPTVDNGKRKVLMELLSPGYKPVQLTQDLKSFWDNAYFDVRKEMRRRYPKHSWPENPMEAEATRGVWKKR